MPIPIKSAVMSALEPYHARIRSVVERAWDEHRKTITLRTNAGLPAYLYDRTVANTVFDAIARLAILEFGSDPGILLHIEAQSVKFYFRGGVLARFKKGNEHLLGQNIPTQAVMRFNEPDCLFGGLPPETAKVEFIWTANASGTSLEDVLVVARDGDRQLWNYSVPAADTVVPLPPRGVAADDFDSATLVTAKKDAGRGSEKAGE